MLCIALAATVRQVCRRASHHVPEWASLMYCCHARYAAVLLQPDSSSHLTTSTWHAEFEEDIVEKTRCEVHIFDPTLSKEQQQLIESNPHFNFHAYGLGPEGVRPNSFRLSTLP